ncbi:MAG: hypothetical protein J7M40_15445 [Planctomycetes bacterium]|nr:hypothetical protein [Planctomycetota bacterium]
MAKSILRAGKIAGVVIVAIILVAVVLYSAGVLSIAQTDYPRLRPAAHSNCFPPNRRRSVWMVRQAMRRRPNKRS